MNQSRFRGIERDSRQNATHHSRALASALPLLALTFAAPALHATNAEFQDYFFAACTAPSGNLAVRCGQTTGGAGNISGDSESSLNPNMALSSNDNALTTARARAKQSREKTERTASGDAMPDSSGVAIDMGRFSLLLHARAGNEESDRVQDIDSERGFETDNWVAEIGLDYRVSDKTVIGAIFGYEEADSEFDPDLPGRNFVPNSDAGDMESTAYSLTVFGSHYFDNQFFIEGSAGYTTAELDITRRAIFQESNREIAQTNSVTTADTDGEDYWASVSAGYAWHSGPWSLTPYAALTWASSSVDSYDEADRSGSGLAMRITSVDRESLTGLLGLSANRVISTGSGVLIPQLRVEYEHEFDRDPETLRAKYLLDQSSTFFEWAGQSSDETYFNVGVAMVWILPGGWMPFIDYESQFGNSDYDRYRITVGLRVEL